MEVTPPKFDPNMIKPRQRKISFAYVIDAFINSIERFPITLCYLLGFITWGVTDCWCYECFYNAPTLIQNLQPALWFLTVNGMLLTFAVSLWCEQTRKQAWHKKIQIVANILLAVDFVNIIFNYNNFSNSVWVGRVAIETALMVSIIFVPALKETSQRHKLMFSFSQFGNMIVAGATAAVMAIALGIINGTIILLFGDINSSIYLTSLIIFSAGLGILIFLGCVKTYDETEAMAAEYQPEKLTLNLVRYILLPLTAIYTIILYVYGVKIIAVGVLPKGEICIMVTALTAVVYLLLFLLKALDYSNEDDKLTRIAIKIFPAALLPLLVMMSVAIGERVGQYGITVDRLYVITFNVWAYATAIYLFITRSRNINSVAISFAIIFLFTSIIPGLNYTSMVNNHMRNRVISALVKVGYDKSQLPLTHNQFEEAKEKMDESSWSDVKSKLRYLDMHDDHSLTEDIAGFNITTGYYSYDPLFEEDDEIVIEAVNTTDLQFCKTPDAVEIPEGYTNVEYISKFKYNQKADEKRLLNFPLTNELNINLDMKAIRALKPDTINSPISFIIGQNQSADSLFVISSIEYSIDEEEFTYKGEINNITVRGYLFTR